MSHAKKHFVYSTFFQEEEEDELDAYMKALEKEAATKGVTASGAPGVAEPKKEETKDGPKVVGGRALLKTGMIMKKPMTEAPYACMLMRMSPTQLQALFQTVKKK